VTEVLDIVLTAVTVEEAAVNGTGHGPGTAGFSGIPQLNAGRYRSRTYSRFEFYEEASGPGHVSANRDGRRAAICEHPPDYRRGCALNSLIIADFRELLCVGRAFSRWLQGFRYGFAAVEVVSEMMG